MVALWEAEDGSRFVSFCIFLFFNGLGVAFMSQLRYNVAKIFLLERMSWYCTDAKANASFSFVGVVQSETG